MTSYVDMFCFSLQFHIIQFVKFTENKVDVARLTRISFCMAGVFLATGRSVIG